MTILLAQTTGVLPGAVPFWRDHIEIVLLILGAVSTMVMVAVRLWWKTREKLDATMITALDERFAIVHTAFDTGITAVKGDVSELKNDLTRWREQDGYEHREFRDRIANIEGHIGARGFITRRRDDRVADEPAGD